MSLEEGKSTKRDPSEIKEDIARVSIKCPQFSENNPNNWFRVLEAQFTLSGISVSGTKYLHALANLPTDVVDNLSEEILDAAEYESLKEAVISFYTKTKTELFERLLSATPVMGRPSAYLRSLQQVASKIGGNEELVRHKFMQSLPPVIATALASQKSLSLTEIGSMADELSPLVNNQVNYVNNYQTNDDRQQQYQKSRHFETRNKFSTPALPLGLRPFGANQRPKICRAHLYFADKARVCKPWCKFPTKRGCNIQPSSRSSSPARSTVGSEN